MSGNSSTATSTAADRQAPGLEELIAETDRISQEMLDANAEEVDRNRQFPRANLAALGQGGVLGLLVPTSYGGAGGGFQEMSRVLERMAQSCPSTAMVTLMHYCGTAVLVAQGKSALKDAVLPAIAKGKHLTTLAFSEPGSGGHFYFPISQLVRNGKGMSLSAKKSFVTSAGEADSYVVSTRSASATGPTDIDLFFVPKETKGWDIRDEFEGLGLRGNASAPMTFQETHVKEEARLGDEKSGFGTMLQVVLPYFQIGSASVALGMAQAAFQKASAHVTARKYEHLGGTSMAEIPRAQFVFGEMALELRSTRAYLGETIRRVMTGDPEATLDVLGIKARAADACLFIASRAMTVCGGTAYGRKGGLERIFRDAQAPAVMAPATDLLKEFLGKASLGIPLF